MQRENRTESAENCHTVEWSQQEASQEGSTKEAQDISSASKIKHSTAMGLKTTALQGGKGQDLRTQKTAVSPRPGPRPLLALADMYLALEKVTSYIRIPGKVSGLPWPSTQKAVGTDTVQQLGAEPRRLLGI